MASLCPGNKEEEEEKKVMREEAACLVAQVGDEHALSRLTADALVEQEEHDAVQVDGLGEELLAVLVQQDGLVMAEEKEDRE
jgi:hypothetical protein